MMFLRMFVLPAVATIAAAMLPLAPASAQVGSRLVTIFGNDPCPRDVICVRAPESDRYRIPQELRGETGAAAAERWGQRAKSLEYVGRSGTQSCSPVGAGGASGCFNELVRKARDEEHADGKEPTIPIKLP